MEAERAARRQTLAKLETEKQALATELGQIKAEYDDSRPTTRPPRRSKSRKRTSGAAQGEVDKLREEIRSTTHNATNRSGNSCNAKIKSIRRWAI